MKLAWNFEEMDLMKRASQPVQGLEPHSQMLTRSVCIEQRTTEGGLFPTYTFLYKFLKSVISICDYGRK